jgi:translation elongation factor P/translation initiation factor 5A
MDILKIEPGPCTVTGQTSSNDGNQFVAKNVEDFAAIKLEEDQGPAASAGIKTELAVSCVSSTSAAINCEPSVSCLSVYAGLCTLDR